MKKFFSKIKKAPQFLKSEVAKLGLFGVLEAFAIIYSKQEFIPNNCCYCKFRINNFPPKIGFTLEFLFVNFFFFFFFLCDVQSSTLKPTVQDRCPGCLVSVVLLIFLGMCSYVHVHFRCLLVLALTENSIHTFLYPGHCTLA